MCDRRQPGLDRGQRGRAPLPVDEGRRFGIAPSDAKLIHPRRRAKLRPSQAYLRRRRPAAGLIFHSDRGSEFLGAAFRQRLAASGIQQSMTRGGAPGENAHMESFFHSLKADLVHGRTFLTVAELRHQLCRYVRYYNYHRLHSSLGYQSPVDYERQAA